MGRKYRCNFCSQGGFPTQHALKLHIDNRPACRKQFAAIIARQATPSPEPRAEASEHVSAQSDINISSPEQMDGADSEVPTDNFPEFVPPPRWEATPEPELQADERHSKRARVEEVEDEEAYTRYSRPFPTSSTTYGDGKTVFEAIFEDQTSKGESAFAPFADRDDWDLARWLALNVNQRATEEFLKMPGVSFVNTDSTKTRTHLLIVPSAFRLRTASTQVIKATICSRRK